MELIPSERVVLSQIRDLFAEASVRTHRFNVLTMRWPVAHYSAYEKGYAGLLSKGLIEKAADGRSFNITSAGLQAMA